MLSVLKQEFFIHKKNILIMSIFIVAMYIGCGILFGLNKVFVSEALNNATAMWCGVSFSLGSLGAFFVALIKGSGSMNDISATIAIAENRNDVWKIDLLRSGRSSLSRRASRVGVYFQSFPRDVPSAMRDCTSTRSSSVDLWSLSAPHARRDA